MIVGLPCIVDGEILSQKGQQVSKGPEMRTKERLCGA